MRASLKLTSVLALGVLAVPAFTLAATQAPVPLTKAGPQSFLERQVRHELGRLAYLGVFDNLSFSVNQNDTVTLYGQVVRPTVKRDAEKAVQRIEGVRGVDNQIEVLPLSYFDNDIRIRAYYALYGTPSLSRYAISARPPIHIVVKNGNVTLEGVVNNEGDRQLAYARVRGLPGTLQVTNNLRLDTPASAD